MKKISPLVVFGAIAAGILVIKSTEKPKVIYRTITTKPVTQAKKQNTSSSNSGGKFLNFLKKGASVVKTGLEIFNDVKALKSKKVSGVDDVIQ